MHKSRPGNGTEFVNSVDYANKQVLDDSRITELGLLTLRVYEAFLVLVLSIRMWNGRFDATNFCSSEQDP